MHANLNNKEKVNQPISANEQRNQRREQRQINKILSTNARGNSKPWNVPKAANHWITFKIICYLNVKHLQAIWYFLSSNKLINYVSTWQTLYLFWEEKQEIAEIMAHFMLAVNMAKQTILCYILFWIMQDFQFFKNCAESLFAPQSSRYFHTSLHVKVYGTYISK